MAKTKHKHLPQRTSEKFGNYYLVLPDGYKASGHQHGSQESFTSTRTAVYRDHRIKIRTTYRIEIDGKPLRMHTEVLDDGTVHCHGLPNYSFPSAMDLARSIVDASKLSVVDRDELATVREGDDYGSHGHASGHGTAEEHDRAGGH